MILIYCPQFIGRLYPISPFIYFFLKALGLILLKVCKTSISNLQPFRIQKRQSPAIDSALSIFDILD
jgi:hypothetical protein